MAKSVEEMRAEYDRMNRRTIPEPQTTEAGSPLAPPILESELAWHMKRCQDCPGGGCLRGAVMTMRQASAFMGKEWAERMGDPEPYRWPVKSTGLTKKRLQGAPRKPYKELTIQTNRRIGVDNNAVMV